MTDNQHDESKLERIIRKIKRCLALSKSSNENEAAIAMRQAQALMREHRLSEADVQMSDVGEVESSHSRPTRRPLWDQHLSSMVAKVFGCKSLRYQHWCEVKQRRVERATFVGVTPTQHIALYAYESLLIKVTIARKEYAASVRSGRCRSAYSAETAGDHFAVAWVGEVYNKLQALVPRGKSDPLMDQSRSSRDLIAVEVRDQALVADYLAGKKVGKARKRAEVELDLDAQIAGMLAGRKAELHAGLATGAQGTLQIASA